MVERHSLVPIADTSDILRSLVKERVQNGLNGILRDISKIANELQDPSLDPSEVKLALLFLMEETIGKIMEVEKRRVSR